MIFEFCQKVSIPDEWKDNYLNKISEWEQEESHSSVSFAQNLKIKLKELNIKIDRLTDAYLEEALELSEYHEKKNKLIEQKKDIEEKIKDFERKGNHWLEPLKNWVFEANQAENLVQQENFSGMKIFLKTIGSNRQILNGKLSLIFPKQYNLLWKLPAEARGETPSEAMKLKQNAFWWCVLASARTIFEQNF